jgi:serine/threonine-protein kinase
MDKPQKSAKPAAPADTGATAGNVDVTQDFEDAPAPARGAAPAAKLNALGDFRLLKKLGKGGMGTVYLAHQVSLDRPAAVKVLSKELAAKPAFVHRFLREARVMARLDHPNIVRCFEVKEEHGYHYLAMEYVDGGSIDGWLRKLGKFSTGDALHIALRTADALLHAHELGLIHRDIKPDNILLNSKGVLKVADLGLAKGTDDDQSMTRTGTGAGTPVFMAPEQARDVKHVDGRSDIYALGCMLYVFVTGVAPFKGETLVELIEAKEREKHPPARQLNPEVPDRLDLIIDKMLAKKPARRYQSCAEIIAELEALGLANDHLSFLDAPGTVRPARVAAARPAAKPTAPPPPPKAGPPAAAVHSVAPAATQDAGADLWYVSFKDKHGKQVTRKMKTAEVLAAIRSGTFTATTQASKTLQGGYRALATFSEFEDAVHLQHTLETADKKGQQFRKMYHDIEKADRRQRRWRWLRGWFARGRNFVGLLIWLTVVGAVLVGAFFGIRWAWNELGHKVTETMEKPDTSPAASPKAKSGK